MKKIETQEKIDITFNICKKDDGKFGYDILFFFRESEDVFTDDGGLTDKFNYFVSKASFDGKEEAYIYGDIILTYMETLLYHRADANGVAALLFVLLTKKQCPQSIKTAMEKNPLPQKVEQSSSKQLPFDDLDVKINTKGNKTLN